MIITVALSVGGHHFDKSITIVPEMEITITIFSRQLRDLNVDGVELETAWANVAIKIQYFFPVFSTPRKPIFAKECSILLECLAQCSAEFPFNTVLFIKGTRPMCCFCRLGNMLLFICAWTGMAY